MAEFIYQMYQARKAVGDKVILDDVTLSFYPGAKIGVVGPNGMGKSTLLNRLTGAGILARHATLQDILSASSSKNPLWTRRQP